MTAGSWYWTSTTLYVWLSGGANPSSHGIEGSTRLAGFFANGGDGSFSYITINGLVFVRGYGYAIRFHDYSATGAGMKGITIENCITTQSGTGKIDGGSYYQIEFMDETNSSDGVQVINNTASYCGGHGNCIEIQSDTGSPLATGNDMSNWNHNGIDVKATSGAMVSGNRMHDQPSVGAGGYIENTFISAASVTFQNNSVWNASNAFQCEGNSSGCTKTVTCNVYNNIDFNTSTNLVQGPDTCGLTVNSNNQNLYWGTGLSSISF
jgi:hypothetical protein